MFDWVMEWPTWSIIRVLGIVSYLLLALGMALGITYSYRFWTKPQKLMVYRWHYRLTISGTAIGLLHGVFLYIDSYMPFSWREIFVPFTANEHPVLNGIGTISVYGMLLLILSTDLRNKLNKALWLGIHLLSYPIFVLSLIHGFFLGTDSKAEGIQYMYGGTVVVIIVLTALSFLLKGNKVKSARRVEIVEREVRQ
ncbi:ferric reductase [Paenibacillus sp. HB172176]|uniref:ferric reductase n=1 Tax=Paenibacillus sp. HB172176 TaxID=2493690 RepID=UPI001439A15E|nr:ferric reductase [Paenibacillus sp. HB172176]